MPIESYPAQPDEQQRYYPLRDAKNENIDAAMDTAQLNLDEYMALQREYVQSVEHRAATAAALGKETGYVPSDEELVDHFISSGLAKEFSEKYRRDLPLAKVG